MCITARAQYGKKPVKARSGCYGKWRGEKNLGRGRTTSDVRRQDEVNGYVTEWVQRSDG